MHKKRKAKKKSSRQRALSTDEESFVNSLLPEIKYIEPSEVLTRVQDPRLAQALAERLPLDNADVIPLLMAFGDHFKEKKVRRTVRRAIFKLRQKGISLEPSHGTLNDPRPVLKPLKREKPSAWVGPLDGTGSRAILISLQRSVRVREVAVGLVSDEQGIQQFMLGGFSKKRLKGMKEQLQEEAGPLVETSLSHAATILERAYQAQIQRNMDIPGDFLELRPWLHENVTMLKRGMIYDILPESEVDQETLTDSRLERLFEHRLMSSWIIALEPLGPFMEDILKTDESPIVLTDAQKADRIAQIKKKALDALFPSVKRSLLRERFEEMAYVFFKLGEKDLSKLSLAAAHGIAEEGGIFQKNPVAEFILERSLGTYMEVMNEAAQDGKEGLAPPPGIILP